MSLESKKHPVDVLYAVLGLGAPPPAFASELAACVKEATFRPGELIVEEVGEIDDEMYMLIDGAARLMRAAAGHEREVAMFAPGDLLAEAHLLLGDSGQDRIVAAGRVRSLVIGSSAMRERALRMGGDGKLLLDALRCKAIAAKLKAATPLAAVPGDVLAELAAGVELASASEGDVLLAEGEPLERLTVLFKGCAHVFQQKGNKRVKVAELFPGDTFGEASLLSDARPTAEMTIVAVADTELCHLRPDFLNACLLRHPEASVFVEQEIAGLNAVCFLRRSAPFAGLDSASLHRIAAASRKRVFSAGEVICKEGEPGEAYYIVSGGQVILDTDESDAVKVMDEIGVGEGFGEGAILSGGRHTYTAIATEETELLVVTKEAFLHAVRGNRGLLLRLSRTLFERQLPVRIPHWTAVRQTTSDGASLYILKDEDRGTYFKLSEQAYYLWEQMDGNTPIRDLVMALFLKYRSLSMDTVIGLIDSLQAAGFVSTQSASADLAGSAKPPWYIRAGMKARSMLGWKRPIEGFDPFITALYRGGGFLLYTKWFQLALAVLSVSGVCLFLYAWLSGEVKLVQLFPDHSASLAAWLAFYGIFLVHALFHEAAHALTVKAYGREVRRAGFGIYFGTPILYVDTSDIWMASRNARIAVSWAGPYFHFALGGAIAWLLLLFPELGAQHPLLVQMMLLNYLFFVANLFPLLEFDGYYMLMDYLEIPKLRSKSLAFLRQQLKKPTSALRWTKVERIYGGFGLVSGIYTAFAIVHILWAVRLSVEQWTEAAFGHIGGAVLGWCAGVALAALLLLPAWNDGRKSKGVSAV